MEFQLSYFILKDDVLKVLHSVCQQIWKNSAVATGLEKISFHSNTKELKKTRYATMDWFQIGKGVCQGCVLSPCLFNLYLEYIMQDAGLDEAQAKLKIVGRNINKLRYADNTTLMAEREEELKSLLVKVKEESEKFGLKLNIQQN